jgi:hypothetical protein
MRPLFVGAQQALLAGAFGRGLREAVAIAVRAGLPSVAQRLGKARQYLVRGSLAREHADLILGNRAVGVQRDARRLLYRAQQFARSGANGFSIASVSCRRASSCRRTSCASAPLTSHSPTKTPHRRITNR